MTKLGQVARIRMGYPFRSRLEHDAAGAIAVVQMKDIDDACSLRVEDAARVNLADIKEHHLIRRGDLVFRSRGRTNSVALVLADIGPAVLAAPMLLVRPMAVLPSYLLWYINLPKIQASLAAQAEGTSVRMISKAALEALELPVPSRRKQQLIVDVAALATAEQGLLEQIAQERKRLADGLLMRYAKTSRPGHSSRINQTKETR
ncbi:MAG: restriction endonuclease subunit S [Sulfuritalea sp.]|nr:restriction endonuclease subunit S [Sulfuritalea sp.]